MREDRISLWFLCHWWVFLPSSSMKVYVITEISSQVILFLYAEHINIANCWQEAGTERAEASTCHLPVGKWRAWRIARSTQAALALLSAVLTPEGSSCPELPWIPQVLSQTPLLTLLSPLICHPLHLSSSRLSMFSSASLPISSPLSLRKGSSLHAKSCPCVLNLDSSFFLRNLLLWSPFFPAYVTSPNWSVMSSIWQLHWVMTN